MSGRVQHGASRRRWTRPFGVLPSARIVRAAEVETGRIVAAFTPRCAACPPRSSATQRCRRSATPWSGSASIYRITAAPLLPAG